MSINYSEKIPNNVNLAEDRTLKRALEQWQPGYLSWWNDMGPDGSFFYWQRTGPGTMGRKSSISPPIRRWRPRGFMNPWAV